MEIVMGECPGPSGLAPLLWGSPLRRGILGTTLGSVAWSSTRLLFKTLFRNVGLERVVVQIEPLVHRRLSSHDLFLSRYNVSGRTTGMLTKLNLNQHWRRTSDKYLWLSLLPAGERKETFT